MRNTLVCKLEIIITNNNAHITYKLQFDDCTCIAMLLLIKMSLK